MERWPPPPPPSSGITPGEGVTSLEGLVSVADGWSSSCVPGGAAELRTQALYRSPAVSDAHPPHPPLISRTSHPPYPPPAQILRLQLTVLHSPPSLPPFLLPRFFVYNSLNESLPQYDDLPKRMLRSAFIGFCASAVSGEPPHALPTHVPQPQKQRAAPRTQPAAAAAPLGCRPAGSPPSIPANLACSPPNLACKPPTSYPVASLRVWSPYQTPAPTPSAAVTLSVPYLAYPPPPTDTCSNSIRVVKTTKQTATVPLSYPEAVKVRASGACRCRSCVAPARGGTRGSPSLGDHSTRGPLVLCKSCVLRAVCKSLCAR